MSVDPKPVRRGKNDVLIEEEMAAYEPGRHIVRAAQSLAARSGREPRDLRVLDWGCGRGRTVAWLRARGFAACGVDIDEKVLHNGHELFRSRGLDPHALLVPFDRVAELPDESFDLVCSQQVLEHVDDLEAAVREIWRLTRPGGTGIHVYPGMLRVREGHLHMPLVHWLPKNRLRWAAIGLLVAAGAGPKWKGSRGVAHDWKRYYRYSVEHTFYRSAREIRGLFAAAGFKLCLENVRARRWLPSALVQNGFPEGPLLLRTAKLAAGETPR